MFGALGPVVALGQEDLVTKALEALACLFAHPGLELEEGLQSKGFQEGPGPFPKGLGSWDCVLAATTGEVGVTPVQLDNCLSALADEGKAEVSEAGFYGFEAKSLGTASVGELYRVAGESEAGQLRIPKTYVWGTVGSVVTGDGQVIDIDLG